MFEIITFQKITILPLTLGKEHTDDLGTTNGVELFNSNYNSQFYHSRPNIYQVIYVLQEIQGVIKLKINSINKQKINILRK